MSSLNSEASLLRRRVVLGVHMLIVCAVMVGLAFHPEWMVRMVGVAVANLYLFALALRSLRHFRRDAEASMAVAA